MKGFFGEHVGFEQEANEKFQQRLKDLDQQFREYDDENIVNENLAEYQKDTEDAINRQFDKFNKEFQNKNKSGNTYVNNETLTNLDNKRASIFQNENRQTIGDKPVE